MPSLGSTILQRDAASTALVEEALARQVLYGGDLATNLLELGALREPRLHELLAEALELPSAPAGPLARGSAEARRLLRADIAERHACYPLELSQDALVVAVSAPLPVPVLKELQIECCCRIIQRAALAFRIHEALARDFAVPLDRRYQRLFASLEGKQDPYPTVPPEKARAELLTPIAVIPAETPGEPPQEPSAPPTMVTKSKPRPEVTTGCAVGGKPHRHGLSARPRHRGPYTAASAEEALLDAEGRDDVLKAFFDFASQYFEYSVIFAVHGDMAEGRDAYGPGADRKRIATIGVPLDLPSVLNAAWKSGQWQIAPLSSEGLNAGLARDLDRSHGANVAVVPVVVRERVVILLYGDHGSTGVELEEIGDVIAFAPLVARALERILLQRKLALRGRISLPPRGPSPEGRTQTARVVETDTVQRIDESGTDRRVVEIDVGLVDQARRDLLSSMRAKNEEKRGTRVVSEDASARESNIEAAPEKNVAAETNTESPKLNTGSLVQPVVQVGAAPSESKRVNADDSPGRARNVATEPAAGDPGPEPERSTQPGLSSQSGLRRPVIGEDQCGSHDPTPDSDAAPTPRRRSAKMANTREVESSSQGEEEESDAAPGSHGYTPETGPSLDELPYLVEQLLQGDHSVLERIIAFRDDALGNLIFHFPGPIHSDPPRPGARKASECGLLMEALVRIGLKSVPFVSVRTADAQPHVRQWATLLLGELPSEESVRSVLSRLGDREASVRHAATAAARQFLDDPSGSSILEEALREMLSPQRDKASRLTAFEYLAELRAPFVIPILLDLLDSSDHDIARSAEWALGVLCRQTFGLNPDAWRNWWTQNRERHRTEWLIDSLTHPQAAVRRAAAEELRSIVPPREFGDREGLPESDLAQAQERYRGWWSEKGRGRTH